MRISLTIPCHAREADLRVCLPALLETVRACPDAELVLVDYANAVPLAETLDVSDPAIRVLRYTGRDTFHMAHARNLGIRAATGDVIVIGSSDLRPSPGWLLHLRSLFAQHPTIDVLRPSKLHGFLAVRAWLLKSLGGFDERFEFYGPEDTDLEHRIERAGVGVLGYEADGWLDVIRTPDVQKIQGYRLPLSKRAMSLAGRAHLLDNDAAGRTVVNVGLEWGAA